MTFPCISQGRSALIFHENDLGGYECSKKLQDLDVLSPSTFILDFVSAIDSTRSSRSSPLCCLESLCVRPILPLLTMLVELQSFPVIAIPMIYSCACDWKGTIPAPTRTFQGCGVDPKLASNQVAEPHVPHVASLNSRDTSLPCVSSSTGVASQKK